MRKKIDKSKTDAMFDGHLEKSLSKMTPREKNPLHMDSNAIYVRYQKQSYH